MEDNKSLLSLKTGSCFSLKSLSKHRNIILPFFGFLVFFICLLFIFSVLLGGGGKKVEVSCGNDWTKFSQSCYKLVKDYNDIEVCRKDCKQEGGDLASIHSMEENEFIVTFMSEHSIWIAGSITEQNGNFSWLDGSTWDFDNWDVGEPDKKRFGKTHHECVFIATEGLEGRGKRGFWWDGVCEWDLYHFDCICKK
eukprot:GFUD01012678.1.p1 GENE.GFUD01012678.1~~GFUD01012678.1.p1  ORF type:complete len:195 (+),score=33.74 GFUD01012678.1:118-702(+)